MSVKELDIKKQESTIRWLKIGIWTYVMLLIFEGALRKWFLPFLATPLLVVRDPVALWIMYMSWKRNLFPSNFYILAMFLATMLSISFSLIFGHGNLGVSIFGARIFIIHFPLMFIIGKIFNKDEVLKLGKVLLLISIPMIVLNALQFYTPQSSWVNRGVGGDMGGAGFSGALGYFRPPGTFSFTNGNTMFFSLVACFVFYFWVSREKINKVVLITATISLIASIPISISRTLLFSIIITILFILIAVLSSNVKYLGKVLVSLLVVIVLLFILSKLPFFQEATEAFTSRFDSASKAEGGLEGTLVDRYLGSMIHALSGNSKTPFFGYGLGMGTNVGSQLLTGGKTFLIAEEEWARLLGEMGFVMGMIVIVIRLSFCFKITLDSFKQMKNNNFLPWVLLSFGLIIIPQGQWAQPTALGFSTIAGGLIMASFKSFTNKIKD
ncbi:hypothetical protein MHTCC0001_29240 [Flavobacteriaceae bacterium MHTCC 0001]